MVSKSLSIHLKPKVLPPPLRSTKAFCSPCSHTTGYASIQLNYWQKMDKGFSETVVRNNFKFQGYVSTTIFNLFFDFVNTLCGQTFHQNQEKSAVGSEVCTPPTELKIEKKYIKSLNCSGYMVDGYICTTFDISSLNNFWEKAFCFYHRWMDDECLVISLVS